MDGYLRQSTASQARLIGPFIDPSDGETAATGLTIANTDIKLRANGTTLSNKNSGGGTHQVNGQYSVSWDATDTANVGELKYSVKVAGAFQVWGSYVVLEEAVYDAMFAAAAPGPLSNAVMSEPGGVVAWASATPSNVLAWVFALARNKITQTSTTQTLRNDADSGSIATSSHSDDGSTHTRNEWT